MDVILTDTGNQKKDRQNIFQYVYVVSTQQACSAVGVSKALCPEIYPRTFGRDERFNPAEIKLQLHSGLIMS